MVSKHEIGTLVPKDNPWEAFSQGEGPVKFRVSRSLVDRSTDHGHPRCTG